MILLRSLLFDALFYLLMLVMGVVCAPLAMISRKWTTRIMQWYCHITLWMLKVICGLRVEVRGQIPQGAVLVASKHQSFLDILVHTRSLPRPRFIMKKELRWVPIFGVYAMRMGSTPVARGRKGGAVNAMVSSAEKNATEPGQLVIYPQGTRVAPGVSAPYKVGAGVLYQRMGVPCVPAATNVGVFWGRNSNLRRPGVAVIEYLDPIAPGAELQDFLSQVEAQVEAASDRLLIEAGGVPPKIADAS
ncbi:MAG: lysophospholipid acyltransferase family protein [Pseudomonadota bacterium]